MASLMAENLREVLDLLIELVLKTSTVEHRGPREKPENTEYIKNCLQPVTSDLPLSKQEQFSLFFIVLWGLCLLFDLCVRFLRVMASVLQTGN